MLQEPVSWRATPADQPFFENSFLERKELYFDQQHHLCGTRQLPLCSRNAHLLWTGAMAITRFFPTFQLTNKEPTPIDTIFHLVEVAKESLDYVFPGNV